MTYRTSAEPEGPEEAEMPENFLAELEPEFSGADAGSMAGTTVALPEEGLEEYASEQERPLGGMFQACFTASRVFVRDHAFAILYYGLGVVAYGYLFVVVGIFFLQNELPKIYPKILDSFSDPYLGILGIFVLVQEMKRRQDPKPRRVWHEIFTVIWIAFLALSSLLTLMSQSYHFDIVYRVIITNSLAAAIIRAGAWLHF